MARSRYERCEVIDGKFLGSFRIPVASRGYRDTDLLDGIKTFDYEVQLGDRHDTLAARYLGAEEYGWVILAVNAISYPFGPSGLYAGRRIKIPNDVRDVLAKFLP